MTGTRTRAAPALHARTSANTLYIRWFWLRPPSCACGAARAACLALGRHGQLGARELVERLADVGLLVKEQVDNRHLLRERRRHSARHQLALLAQLRVLALLVLAVPSRRGLLALTVECGNQVGGAGRGGGGSIGGRGVNVADAGRRGKGRARGGGGGGDDARRLGRRRWRRRWRRLRSSLRREGGWGW